MSEIGVDEMDGREAAASGKDDAPESGAGRAIAEPRSVPKRSRPPAPKKRSVFEIYKRGQGAYTRGGTAIGAGVLIAAGANFVYQQLGVYRIEEKPWTLWLQAGIPLFLLVGLGLFTYWVVGVNRKACDFMIATEGEMKKVNWSTRREIIGSTKVVIMFTMLLGIILFSVDMLFMSFFAWIGVLKGAPSLLKLLLGGQS